MSSAGPSTCSGEAAVTTVEMRGRARNLSRSPDERLADAADGVDLAGAVDEGHVLGRLGEQREVLRRARAARAGTSDALTCVHMMSSSRQLVHERRALAQVLQRAGAPHAGAEVERLGDAAAGREVEGLALVQQHVVLRGERRPAGCCAGTGRPPTRPARAAGARCRSPRPPGRRAPRAAAGPRSRRSACPRGRAAPSPRRRCALFSASLSHCVFALMDPSPSVWALCGRCVVREPELPARFRRHCNPSCSDSQGVFAV